MTAESDLHSRVQHALSGQYEVEQEIGRGGMGIVYCARDRRLKRPVAVKVLPPELAFDPKIRSRFLSEAETAAQLSHPNIVPIYTVDDRDGLVFFVMGFIGGDNLGKHLRKVGRLPIHEARRILREVADALAYAHSRGVVHRDIKPDNILIARDTGRAMVTDFGIARAVSGGSESRLTATGVAIGTPAYMSPEQCAGERELDGRSDLYSLGVVAYEMLAGKPPFSAANTPAMLIKHVSENPIPVEQVRRDVPEDFAGIVSVLLAKDPGDRFRDGASLVAALDSGETPKRPAPRPARNAMQLPGFPPAAPVPDFPGGFPLSRRERKRAARRKAREERENRPLAQRIRDFRRQFMGYVATSFFLAGINLMTGPEFFWAAFPIFGMGLGVMKPAGALWADGVRFRDIFGKGARDMLVASREPKPVQVSPPASASALQASGEDEAARLVPRDVLDGRHGAAIRQAVADRKIISDLVAKLGPADRALIPEVAPTANALVERLAALAVALDRLDADIPQDRLPNLDDRIKAAEESASTGSDQERTLALLRRQRKMLDELLKSRAALSQQLESAGLLLQNMRLDPAQAQISRSSGRGGRCHECHTGSPCARARDRARPWGRGRAKSDVAKRASRRVQQSSLSRRVADA